MKRAVIVCPGRGTYNRPELGSLSRLHPDKRDLFARFDAQRTDAGQPTLSELDGSATYSVARHTRGDNASALIYAASIADFLSLQGVEVVAVTGNSMGWYSTLACSGALDLDSGFTLVNTMGRMMQESLIGGQLVYPVTGEDWRADPKRRESVVAMITIINQTPGCMLMVSIDLGGMLVLAGNKAGLEAFIAAAPPLDRFPMSLANHAAFHTALQNPVSEAALALFAPSMFVQPKVPMIDGRGAIWWPRATDLDALFSYTLGHQVVELYDFKHAIKIAAREFAPDLFIVLGPGTTLGGSVAQSLIACNWKGMGSKADFQTLQAGQPVLVSMGREESRGLVAK